MKPPILRPIIVTLLIIFGALLGIGGLFAYQEYTNEAEATSFATCMNARDSIVLESYPATCVTKRGKRFVQPVDDVTPPDPTGKDTMPVQEFRCPDRAWVDCMPGPDTGVRFECTDEFLSWAKANCPNFTGAAY